MTKPSIAIVHDYFVPFGGAERVVIELANLFPEAPIFTSAFLPDNFPVEIRHKDMRTSFIQRFPALSKSYRAYAPLYPLAFNFRDLKRYDLLLCSSSAWAHYAALSGVKTVCYCHTPPRFLWRTEAYLQQERASRLSGRVLKPFLTGYRMMDARVSKRVDTYVANSLYVADRIARCYDRASEVVYPPVSVSRFSAARVPEPEDYYLVVSRLLAYKRIDLAIQAFNKMRKPLKIVGSGPDFSRLRGLAGPTVELLGRVPDERLPSLMANSRALIFPGEEDFGIAPVEAMASGRPVIAYGGGGALETVVEGVTGTFFTSLTESAVAAAVERLQSYECNAENALAQAQKFDELVFRQRMLSVVSEALTDRV